MKKVNILLVSLVVALFAIAQEPAKEGAEISFEKTTHDFGQVKEESGKATYAFVFTNTGTEPLVVSKASASCGCTVPDWTKTPIEPGKTGTIVVTYNASGRPGVFNKSVTVSSNSVSTPSQRLIIKGEVLPKAAAPEQPKSAVAK